MDPSATKDACTHDVSAPGSSYSFDDVEQPSIFGNKQFVENNASIESEGSISSTPAPAVASEDPPLWVRTGTFRFSCLPIDLRTKIYEYTLIGDGAIYIVDTENNQDLDNLDIMQLRASIGYFDYDVKEATDDIVSASVTLGMTQLHPSMVKESQEVLYGRNKFILRGFKVLLRFLKQIGRNRALLRNIEILHEEAEDLSGAMVQVAVGLLTEAALSLEHLHLGVDLAGPFVEDPDDPTRFTREQPNRLKKMAKYAMPCLVRIFRIHHLVKEEPAEQFLSNIVTVHPTSFDPYGNLPLDPYLLWEEESQYTAWEPSLNYHDYQVAAAELRSDIQALLEVEGQLKAKRREPWVVGCAKVSMQA